MPSQKYITIRFYEELNDFLPGEKRKKDFEYHFTGNPSIKDVIEAIGIPHPEVDMILVNGKSVCFGYNIQPGDHVSVYPVFELIDISPINRLRPEPLRNPRFILDVNLGKLASKLRMMGFDSLYENSCRDYDIIKIAAQEKRIILTRDLGLLKNKKVNHGYWVRNTNPAKQIREIVDKFDLRSKIQPFTICMTCNGKIKPVKKNKVFDKLPPKVKKTLEEFYQCSDCKKVYWKGTHYIKMQAEIQLIQNDKPPE
ncbi:MAG TPA: twitching motility protein PilT [Caldithrix sp.]|nr:Mut7-C ubiquitin/RNAse domain-containing protein [Calditrichaceae bacterium]HEM49564.1 twitching motility protein PilT [Caldithrix sp.]